MNHALGQLKHLDLGGTDNIGVANPSINPKHVPRLPATTDNLMCSSIYSVDGSQANPIVVPRLNLKERTQQESQISVFKEVNDSVSDRAHLMVDDRKKGRQNMRSNITSTDFDSVVTRNNTVDTAQGSARN